MHKWLEHTIDSVSGRLNAAVAATDAADVDVCSTAANSASTTGYKCSRSKKEHADIRLQLQQQQHGMPIGQLPRERTPYTIADILHSSDDNVGTAHVRYLDVSYKTHTFQDLSVNGNRKEWSDSAANEGGRRYEDYHSNDYCSVSQVKKALLWWPATSPPCSSMDNERYATFLYVCYYNIVAVLQGSETPARGNTAVDQLLHSINGVFSAK